MRTLFKSVSFAALLTVAAPCIQPAFAEDSAVFSFSGKKGKPAKVVDHQAGGEVTLYDSAPLVNQSSASAIEATAARRQAMRQSLDEARAEEAAAAAAAAASAQPVEAEPAPMNSAPLPPEVGLRLLREKDWVTLNSDAKNYPTEVYNLDTKQFMPTAEAIKLVQPQPVTSVTAAPANPPAARKSDPTP